MYHKLLPFLLLTTVSAVASAQTPPDTTLELPEAVVEDYADAPLSPARLIHIDAAALASAPSQSVADVLARTGNIYVQRYGPSGLATASFRGTGAKNTAVYLDGLLLSDPQSNQIDLAVIPLVMIESIDVQHGLGSASMGTGSLGGSVRLNTLRPAEKTLKVTGEGGRYGKYRLGVTGGTSIGSVRIAAAGEASEFESDYPYRNPTLIDTPEQTREGADRSLRSLFATAEYREGGHHVTGSGWLNSVERGLPGPGNAPPAGARQWDDQIRGWLTSRHQLDLWVFEFSALANRNRLRYVNQTTGSNDTTSTNTATVSGLTEHVVGSNLLVGAGFTTGFDWTPDVTEWRLAASTEATWDIGRLFVLPSVRFESRRSDFSELNAVVPRLGLAVYLDESENFLLKSNFGRSYRMPSLLERFWKPGGNPDLAAEYGWAVDAGLAGKLGDGDLVEFETTVFFTRVDDQIAWFPSFVGSGLQIWTPYNVGRTHTYGVEYSLEADRQFGGLDVHAGVSGVLNRAVDRSDENAASFGKQLRYNPQITTALFVRVEALPFTLDLSGRQVGPRYVTSDEGMEIPAYFVVDVQVAYDFALQDLEGRLALQAENLIDADYSVIRFYPMPPRLLTLRLDLEID